jgi:uncharacterized flavoprotein (TIGR03862 family)
VGVDAQHRRVVSPGGTGGDPVVVVGGGPAGLMAAEVVSAAGRPVVVIERMPTVGRKLLIAGRGGLNLTHSEPLTAFIGRYGPASERLGPIIETFPPTAAVVWAEGLGQPTFVGSSGRVFPRALKASPLLRAWLQRLARQGVVIRTRTRWLGFDGADRVRVEGRGGVEMLRCGALILALGGASWPRLGSDGAWTSVLHDEGIAVAPLGPANAGVRIAWTPLFAQRFAGAPVKRIAVTIEGETRRGEAIVTRHGLEGGAIYALNPAVRAALAEGRPVQVAIDLRPDDSLEALTTRFSRPRGKQSMTTYLRKAVNLAPAAIGLLRESGGATLPSAPEALARLIKAVTLPVTGLAGLERAISSSGGIRLEALDADLMLAARPGVFTCGEMLDWEAPTGGYLLQASLATGVAAGQGALRWLGRAASAG